jgi:hypothetical protein
LAYSRISLVSFVMSVRPFTSRSACINAELAGLISMKFDIDLNENLSRKSRCVFETGQKYLDTLHDLRIVLLLLAASIRHESIVATHSSIIF